MSCARLPQQSPCAAYAHTLPLNGNMAVNQSSATLMTGSSAELGAHLLATLATREESSPPDSSTPRGASDMSRFTTAEMKPCCRADRADASSYCTGEPATHLVGGR